MSFQAATIAYIFSVAGFFDAAYLSYHAIRRTDVACWFFPKEWCRTVQYSRFSKTFGIPNPFLGLGMYVAIAIFTFLASQNAAPAWIAKAIICFGFLFSLYFTYIQAFVLRAFCTWCVLSAVNFTVMFIGVFAL